jgi:hypothetical protein
MQERPLTATGVVVGIGEIFGGALAPAVGGMADAMGIPAILKITMAAIGLPIPLVLLSIREPKSA